MECVSCNEQLASEEMGVRAGCDDWYCRDCLKQLFIMSLKDDTLFPPRCHNQEIGFDGVCHLFDKAFASAFERRLLERNTSDRVYCPDGSCATFLGARSPSRKVVFCPGCGKMVCLTCKSSHLPYESCPSRPDEEAWLKDLLRQNKWQKCPQCNSLVELTVSSQADRCIGRVLKFRYS